MCEQKDHSLTLMPELTEDIAKDVVLTGGAYLSRRVLDGRPYSAVEKDGFVLWLCQPDREEDMVRAWNSEDTEEQAEFVWPCVLFED